jgi:hypothetical protein
VFGPSLKKEGLNSRETDHSHPGTAYGDLIQGISKEVVTRSQMTPVPGFRVIGEKLYVEHEDTFSDRPLRAQGSRRLDMSSTLRLRPEGSSPKHFNMVYMDGTMDSKGDGVISHLQTSQHRTLF